MSADKERIPRHEERDVMGRVCAGCFGPATHTHVDQPTDPAEVDLYGNEYGCCGGRMCCEDEDGHEE